MEHQETYEVDALNEDAAWRDAQGDLHMKFPRDLKCVGSRPAPGGLTTYMFVYTTSS